jgi:hypothetical protein
MKDHIEALIGTHQHKLIYWKVAWKENGNRTINKKPLMMLGNYIRHKRSRIFNKTTKKMALLTKILSRPFYPCWVEIPMSAPNSV